MYTWQARRGNMQLHHNITSEMNNLNEYMNSTFLNVRQTFKHYLLIVISETRCDKHVDSVEMLILKCGLQIKF